jgi:predicted DNA-binding protein
MSLESRSKMISVRLTNEEYERFRELCFSHGIPSVSEMARAAINMLFSHPSRLPAETVESRLKELESRLQMLSQEVKKLAHQGTAPGTHALAHPAKNGIRNQ